MIPLLRFVSTILVFTFLFLGIMVSVFTATDTDYTDAHARMWLVGITSFSTGTCSLACLHFAYRPKGRCRKVAVISGCGANVLLLVLAGYAFTMWNATIWATIFTLVAGVTMGTLLIARPKVILEGHCPDCGYDLTGLKPESVCPECGAAVALAAVGGD